MSIVPSLALQPSVSSARVLTAAEWTERSAAHHARVAPHADAFVSRRARGEKHPVHDFLFTYYSFAPAKLKQWTPALGAAIEIRPGDLESHPWLASARFVSRDGVLSLDESKLDTRARDSASWIAQLCHNIIERPPRFACFGLHEWAMVYRQSEEQIRHHGHRLRLTRAQLAEFIESQTLCCSHYDAFRFFTPEARPLNSFQPTLESRQSLEQGGCLHANMDLYKWTTKLWPWCGADLIADTFLLALEGRDLDMRASPYDLADLGYAPVKIETQEGRARYEKEQRSLAEKSRPLRQRLQAAAARISGWHS